MSDQPSIAAWESTGVRRRGSVRHGALATFTSVAAGLAIWIPTAAMQPRVDYVGDSSMISGWY
ncbi:MAG TPA: hypothetical protein VFZ83_13790, partial [Acidimicrobiia bacterium]|nr:hypothetical protein [Acidimicrobiia bacterium]